jgi:hypothetical protein
VAPKLLVSHNVQAASMTDLRQPTPSMCCPTGGSVVPAGREVPGPICATTGPEAIQLIMEWVARERKEQTNESNRGAAEAREDSAASDLSCIGLVTTLFEVVEDGLGLVASRETARAVNTMVRWASMLSRMR